MPVVQSGRTPSGKDRCVHSLATQHRNQCEDTASRFIEAVPSYQLDWTAVGYSMVATGAFWDSLLVVASGGHPSSCAKSASTRSYSGATKLEQIQVDFTHSLHA